MRFLGNSLRSEAKARRASHEFADMVGRVINATVSRAPVTFIEVEGGEFTCFVAHCENKVPAALPLVNGRYLFVYNRLGLRRKEKYLATLEYRYWYQETPRPESWLIRWEYLREPPDPYPYAKCHVHVNASPAHYTGSTRFARLHLPTGPRVTIEQVVRHLITEHNLPPISDQWEQVVAEAEAHFDDIQRRRYAN